MTAKPADDGKLGCVTCGHALDPDGTCPYAEVARQDNRRAAEEWRRLADELGPLRGLHDARRLGRG